MAKKQKERKVDYTQQDMLEMTGFTRKQFFDGLKKVCDMYNFDIMDFKVDETNKDSGYFFPPEVAELLVLLLRHLPEHPLSRANADKTKITATEISKYNQIILDDIDSNLALVFKKILYCRRGHLVSQEIADWALPLVKQFTYFLVNLTTLKSEDVGAALKLFTKELDKMNYNLFRGNYAITKALEVNNEAIQDDDERRELNKRLNTQNISIDIIISDMIKWELVDAHQIREDGFPDLKDILDYENALYKVIGQKLSIKDREGKCLFEDIKDPSDKELREAYYSYILSCGLDEAEYCHNTEIMEYYREYTKKWNPIDERIRKGTFAEPQEKTIKEQKDILRNNIICAEKDIEEYKKILEGLEQQEEENAKNEFLAEIQNEYANHCSFVDKEYKELHDIVDRFVGQALSEFLK